MPEIDPNASVRPLRHGEAWTWTDFEQLLQGVFNGLSLQEIAAELQRTSGAVRAQLPRLVPDDAKIQRTTQALMGWLRRRLTESPEYDWQTVLNSHSDDPYRLWSRTHARRRRIVHDRIKFSPVVDRVWVSRARMAVRRRPAALAIDSCSLASRPTSGNSRQPQ
jgi:hypothetical protein